MESNTKLSLAASQALVSEEAQALFSELRAEGYPLLVSKKQYAKIAGCSISTLDNQIKDGFGPNYKKIGRARNAKILYSLIDVANYFSSQTILTT